MTIPDYSSHFYVMASTSEVPVFGQNTGPDNYKTLLDLAQFARGDQDESRLEEWLARVGIRMTANSNDDEVAAPAKFKQLRKQEFDRRLFDYDAYLTSLEHEKS